MNIDRCPHCWGTGDEPSPVTTLRLRCRRCGGFGWLFPGGLVR